MNNAAGAALSALRPGSIEPLASLASVAPQADRQREFASILSRRIDRPGAAAASPEEQATDAARQLVSITLVQPLLAQLRETSQAAPPFAPTQAERQFRAMADAHLAQNIVRAADFPLVDVLARRMLAKLERGATVAAPDKEVRS